MCGWWSNFLYILSCNGGRPLANDSERIDKYDNSYIACTGGEKTSLIFSSLLLVITFWAAACPLHFLLTCHICSLLTYSLHWVGKVISWCSCYMQVWYLLGLLNYLRGTDFKHNARHYLNKGIQVRFFRFCWTYLCIVLCYTEHFKGQVWLEKIRWNTVLHLFPTQICTHTHHIMLLLLNECD